MRAWKLEPVICDPPVEEWSFLQFPGNVSIQRVDAINMQNLSELYLNGQGNLTEFPWQDIPSLEYLSIDNSGLTELPVWRVTGLINCYCYDNYSLISVDAHGQINLTLLNISWSTELTVLNLTGCTGLNSLSLNSLPLLTDLDISTCCNLGSINLTTMDGITELDLSPLTNLTSFTLNYCDGLMSIDVSACSNLERLYLNRCEQISDIDLSGCSQLDYVYLRNLPLDQAMVDQIFEDLVNNGASDGYLRIDGTGTAVPSNPDGLASKTTLISRGWTVYTN